MTPVALGLDFGTSNSVAALGHGEEVTPVTFADGSAVQRTLFFFPEEPGPMQMGNAAATAYYRIGTEGRLVQSLKSHLAGDLDQLTLGDVSVPLEALLGHFLKFIRAEASRVAGRPLESVVLGRPVRFHLDDTNDKRAERRLVAAAKNAGFKKVALQFEPIAAALDYERTTSAEELVLVGDLGGGTSDFAVVRVGPERGLHDRGKDVIATSGVPLAGNALDRDVVRDHLLWTFGSEAQFSLSPGLPETPWEPGILAEIVDLYRVPFLRDRKTDDYLFRMKARVRPPEVVDHLHDLIFRDLGFSLAESVERTKVALTDADEARIRYHEASIDLDQPLTRPQFDTSVAETVFRIERALDDVLQRAGVGPDAITRVFLTGGTSQVPVLRAAFIRRFGAERVYIGDVFTSVARGLARSWPLLG